MALAHGVQVVRVEHRQISRARNAGAEAAAGETLIFVDADTLVPAETLRATVEALRQGAVGGGVTVRFEGRLPLYARPLLAALHIAMRAGRLAAGVLHLLLQDRVRGRGRLR